MLKRVTELESGDAVDLQNDPYADPYGINPLFPYEYITVDCAIQETPDCVLVYFEGFDAVGFPIDHWVEVGEP